MIQQMHLTTITVFKIHYILYGDQASGRGGKLTTYLHLVQKLIISTAILSTPSTCLQSVDQNNFTFTLH